MAWKALLDQVPPPKVVVCDGGSGLLVAVAEVWPDTLVQRCLVHVRVHPHVLFCVRPDV